MKVEITYETLRSYRSVCYDCTELATKFSTAEIIRLCLGDFYSKQDKYTRLRFVEVIYGDSTRKMFLD